MNRKPRKVAYFTLDPVFLADALGMPKDHNIVGADWNLLANTVRVYVEGPEMPEVQEGCAISQISPTISCWETENGIVNKRFDWNVKK